MSDVFTEIPEKRKYRVHGPTLKRLCVEAALSAEELAEACGWSRQYVHSLLSRFSAQVSATGKEKIERALRLQVTR